MMYRGINKAMFTALVAVVACAGVVPVVHADSPVPQVSCKAISLPRKTKVSIIAPRIVIDGIPMTIVSASNAESPDKFAAYFKQLWKGSGAHPLYVINQIGPWNVIAHKDGKCMYTVQIKRDKPEAVALVGIGTPGNKVTVRSGFDFPAPGDARTLTRMVSQDNGTVGETWMLYTANSVQATAKYYQTVLPQYGWKMLVNTTDVTGTNTVLMFQNGNRNAGLSLQPFRRGAAITVTVMRR